MECDCCAASRTLNCMPVTRCASAALCLERPGETPELARLTVRCCLADATPAGIPILWPEDANPEADQWLEIEEP